MLAKAAEPASMTTERRMGMEEVSTSTLEHNAQVVVDLQRQLVAAQAKTFKLQQHYEDMTSALQDNLSQLQIENSELTDDTMSLLEAKQGLEDIVSEHESREYSYQQTVAYLEQALAAARNLPPMYPTALPSKPWTVPAMNKRIDQLTLQLADLQVQYEAVQQSAGHTGDMQEVFDELTEREFEVSVLSSTVKNLQHENLRLEVHSQGVSDTNEELKEQVAELQSQLQQLKDTHLEQEQAHELELAQFSQVVADLETALAAVPDMEAKIEQLTEELALLHTDYDELRQSSVQRADVQGVYHNLAETERKVSTLTSTVTSLQEENLWLRDESQCVLDSNQQLQEQIVDLQGQLQQLQNKLAQLEEQQTLQLPQQQNREDGDVVITVSQDQLLPLRIVRASSDPDVPATPDLIAGSFVEADSSVLTPDSDTHSSSMQCSSDNLVTNSRPQSRALPRGNRGRRVGKAVMSAAAAGFLIMIRLRASRS